MTSIEFGMTAQVEVLTMVMTFAVFRSSLSRSIFHLYVHEVRHARGIARGA